MARAEPRIWPRLPCFRQNLASTVLLSPKSQPPLVDGGLKDRPRQDRQGTFPRPKSSTFHPAASSQNPTPAYVPEEYESSQGMGAVASFLTQVLSSEAGKFNTIYGLLPESQGQNMELTVLYVPCSLDSGLGFRVQGLGLRFQDSGLR